MDEEIEELRYCHLSLFNLPSHLMVLLTGTLFVGPSVNDIGSLLAYIASQPPSISDSAQMNALIDHVMQHYPDIASLGNLLSTGNETFGLSSARKDRCCC
jgi:hypothetical protein